LYQPVAAVYLDVVVPARTARAVAPRLWWLTGGARARLIDSAAAPPTAARRSAMLHWPGRAAAGCPLDTGPSDWPLALGRGRTAGSESGPNLKFCHDAAHGIAPLTRRADAGRPISLRAAQLASGPRPSGHCRVRAGRLDPSDQPCRGQDSGRAVLGSLTRPGWPDPL